MKRFLFLMIPALLCSDDLKSLLEYARQHNSLVVSSALTKDAKEQEMESRKSDYFPTIDVGAFYQSAQDRSYTQPGDVYSGYVKLGFDIYDGGKKSSLLGSAEDEYKASGFDTKELKKNLSLQIVQDYYEIKSFNASLQAREDAQKSLSEQLERMKKFYEAKLATTDDVDRLQSAYDTNLYEIESLKFQILSVKKSLQLKVGKSIPNLEDSNFKEILQDELELAEGIRSLMAKESSLLNTSESIGSVYYPKVRVEDTYSVYGYNRTDALHPEGVDNQNVLLLSVNMRLFDYGSVKEAKQALQINSRALSEQIKYKTAEQKMHQELATARIDTSKMKIKSSKSALVAAKSAFKTINEKYNAGIVDYVVYLDALSSQTSANALYKKSLNDLEVAYAMYYYYSGKNLEEFIK
ncbi:TolC family protein [bacterium]|nr:TolC family protein [bacterium]MBU1995175.1 TolC family protein [bacterium]